MSTSEERRQLTSPFLDEELFVTDAGREWEPRLVALKRASPFLTESDQPYVPSSPERPEELDILDEGPRWLDVDEGAAEETELDLDVAAQDVEEMFEPSSAEEVETYFEDEDPSYEHLTEDESEAIGSEVDWTESEDDILDPTPLALDVDEEVGCGEEIPPTDDELSDETSHLETDDQEGEIELFEPEEGDDIPGDVATFATQLGAEWSKRLNGSPSATEKTAGLLQDYKDTIEGARRRWHGKRIKGKKTPLFGRGKHTREAIGRAWMISRREEMAFRTSFGPEIMPLVDFKPPTASGHLISSRLIEKSEEAPVAPIVSQFVEILRRKYPNALGVSTYRGHGGGQFNNRGYSVDLFLEGRNDRGFYPSDASLGLLRAVQEAAHAVRAEWRIIYNDFAVADLINRETGKKRVIFAGTVRRQQKQGRVTGLNWHGPDPLILHFHLDLVPRTAVSSPADIGPAATQVDPKQKAAPSKGRPPTELVRFVQQVLNSTEGENLVVDGVEGPMTRGALERFRRRYALGTGSALDARTELALAQRALEQIAQQSLFARIGVNDTKTEQVITEFRVQHRLGSSSFMDAATRAALLNKLPASGSLGGAVTKRPTPPRAPTSLNMPRGKKGRTAPPASPTAYRRFRLTTYHLVTQRDMPTGAIRVPIYGKNKTKIAEGSPRFFANLSLEGSGFLTDGRLINVVGRLNWVDVSHGEYAEVLAYHQQAYAKRNARLAKEGKKPIPTSVSGIIVINNRVVKAKEFYEVPESKRGLGYGVQRGGIPLEPFRTLAADTGILLKADPSWKGKGGLVPVGTEVYIKEFDGLELPDGRRHDGWFVVNDTGGGIFGAHFDVFTGTEEFGKHVRHIRFGNVWFDGIDQRIPADYSYGLSA